MRTQIAGAFALVLFTVGSSALAEKAPKADNTAQNYGALNKDAVTAQKQGNSKNAVLVAAAIRRSIVAEKGLSLNAQNVKIVCSEKGRVTLRGPVDSNDEKAQIGNLVKSCDGVTSIKNELTIAAKKH